MKSMNEALWNGAGRRIHMQEVGTRDGLQVETVFVPTEDKIALVNALSLAGMAKIEVTSFTSPKAIPALADGEIVLREIGLTDVLLESGNVSGTLGQLAPEKVVAALVNDGVPVTGFAVQRPSLEDLFVSLTGEGFDVSG